MCGRFTLATTNEELTHRFKIKTALNYPVRWNIAPSQTSLTVTCDADSNFCLNMHDKFGVWQSGLRKLIINARSETITEKPLFSEAYKYSRCLVLASGWYEWDAKKNPHYISLRDDRVMAFAALRLKKLEYHSFVIITAAATGDLARLHHRTPVILQRKWWLNWLLNVQGVSRGYLSSPSSHFFKWHRVSTKVGNVKNDFAELVLPVTETKTQNQTNLMI